LKSNTKAHTYEKKEYTSPVQIFWQDIWKPMARNYKDW